MLQMILIFNFAKAGVDTRIRYYLACCYGVLFDFCKRSMKSVKRNSLHTQTSKIIALLKGCRKNDRGSQKKVYVLLFEFASNICNCYTDLDTEPIVVIHEGFLKFFKIISQFDENNQQDFILPALRNWLKELLIDSCEEHSYKLSPSGRVQKVV